MKQQVEEERERQIKESKDPTSTLNTERNKTYDRLVLVQEHLLHHVRGLKVGGGGGGGGGMDGGGMEVELCCVCTGAIILLRLRQQLAV